MLTRKGRIVTGAGVLALATGLVLANPLLLAIGGALLLVVAVASFFLRRVRLEVARTVSAEALAEDQELVVEVAVQARGGSGRSFVEIRDRLPDAVELGAGSNYALVALRGAEPLQLRYELSCPVKGRFAIGPLEYRVQDALGLFHEDREVDVVSRIVVHPRIFDLRDALVRSKFPLVVSGDYLVGNPGLGSSFFALREYQVGDSIRSINWKASARSSKLVVNQTERESQARATFLLDNRAVSGAGTPRRNAAVWSARAAASVARFILRRRDRVRLYVYGEGIRTVNPDGGRQDVVLNEALAEATPAGSTTLFDAVSELLPTLKRRTPVVIFSGLLDDPTAGRAIEALRAYEANVVVLSPDATSFLRDGGAKADDPAYLAARLEREELVAALKGLGAWVVDWNPDEPLSVVMAREVGRA